PVGVERNIRNKDRSLIGFFARIPYGDQDLATLGTISSDEFFGAEFRDFEFGQDDFGAILIVRSLYRRAVADMPGVRLGVEGRLEGKFEGFIRFQRPRMGAGEAPLILVKAVPRQIRHAGELRRLDDLAAGCYRIFNLDWSLHIARTGIR